MTLSVTIATKNEALNLHRCLKSINFADEIVIVDDCSQDNTLRIAQMHGVKTLSRDSTGSFHENKNLAIEKAKGDWIFSLDADEIVSPELANSIISVLNNPVHDGYLVDRHNYFLGQWIRNCGWYPNYILRLFRKGAAWWPNEIHDVPKLLGGNNSAGMLEGPLIHFSYNDLNQYFEKFNRYTSRLAEEYAQKHVYMKGPYIPLNLFLRPSYWFLKKYIINTGFKDGLPGFFICFSSALTIFVSYLKLWHSQNERIE